LKTINRFNNLIHLQTGLMAYTTLISSDQANQHLQDTRWVFVDCRYYLDHTQQGRREYSQAHIPGALYADLGKDLSSPVVPGVTGRHPLPDVKTLSQTFSRWGVGPETQVVVYDQGPGMIAARLWWMLQWLGHDKAAVLEGGWKKWQQEGGPVSQSLPMKKSQVFTPVVHPELVADADDILAEIANPHVRILDARAADRYRGENETLDPVAGHIPGALSAPFMCNLGADGLFRSIEELQSMYNTMLGHTPTSDTIIYCGSGVTAAHNILVLKHIGMGMARLYPGSWSHWITDKQRPTATGE
jgi:thiosulfate/3-mercaptopyruvate sulfurtransferase